MGKKWIIVAVIVAGIIMGGILGIFFLGSNDISNTNMIDTQKLADKQSVSEAKESSVNEVVETSSLKTNISPNAIIIEKRYYKACDHLIREVMDIPESLVNKKEDDVKARYKEWKVEGYSPTEIVVYKEFKGLCNEHYVVKENNGVIGIFVQDENNVLEWQEDTEIVTKYLPDEDLENLKIGVKIVGKTNLSTFLEDYE